MTSNAVLPDRAENPASDSKGEPLLPTVDFSCRIAIKVLTLEGRFD